MIHRRRSHNRQERQTTRLMVALTLSAIPFGLLAPLNTPLISTCSAAVAAAPPQLTDTPGPARNYAVFLIKPDGTDVSQIGCGASGVSENGQVTGAGVFPPLGNIEQPFRWVNGVTTLLDRVGGSVAFGSAINDGGIIAGQAYLGAPTYYNGLTLWIPGMPPEYLGSLIGNVEDEGAEGYDINDAGYVTGQTVNADHNYQAFVWYDGVWTAIPGLGGGSAWGLAINNQNQVVGEARTSDNIGHAFIWNDNLVTRLNDDGYSDSLAEDINDSDSIVGYGYANGIGTRIMYWDQKDSQPVMIGPVSGINATYASAINNHGQIIGSVSGYFGGGYPCMFLPGPNLPWFDLNDSLPPNSKWQLEAAADINDAGQIVGSGRYGRYDGQGYVMSPVHPDITLDQVMPGRAGTTNTLTVHGATPNADVYFGYSLYSGGAVIPGGLCPVQTNALQLEDPQVIGHVQADSHGNATISRFVPAGARQAPNGLVIQAWEPANCRVSQLIVQTFQ